jgi:NAD(P)-dependent dehydrogenase (short-subunit alcohol dehydrogenase family)
MADLQFAGLVAFVSGAGRGFGRRVAERLAAAGATLLLTDFSDELVAGTIDAIRKAGGRADGLSGDIALEETSRRMAGLADRLHGRLDIAINNAGIAQTQQRLHETDSALARRVIDVDLMGVFHAMKHQLPLLMRTAAATGRQTTILNVASAAGVMGSPMIAAYAAAKHGVVGLTRSAAIEYARKGVRVNCLCPAFAKTDMVTKPLEADPRGRDKALASMTAFNPMQRLGEIDEVVEAMLFAVSPANSFFNGQALSVDGGLSA